MLQFMGSQESNMTDGLKNSRGDELLNRCRVSILQQRVLKTDGDGWLHNSVTVLNAAELYTLENG